MAAAEAQVATLSEELQTVKDPRHFTSLQELISWLAQDDTDTAYAGRTATELVLILQVRALRDGYLLPANMEDVDGDYNVDIVGNIAYIGGNGYVVVPGTDDVVEWFRNIPPIPSHPLPLS
jgi:hypothetical protein